jgi:hypothetical protein
MQKKMSLMVMIVACTSVMFATSIFAADFHINPAVDSLGKKDHEQYVGSAVSAVTQALGSPSMVRDNQSDPAAIDYIFIGNSNVYTFVVKREGKQVTAAHKDKRGSWEGGVYPGYPLKKNK